MHLRLWENLVGPEAQHMAPFLFPPVVWLVIFSANEHRREGFEDVTQDSLTSCWCRIYYSQGMLLWLEVIEILVTELMMNLLFNSAKSTCSYCVHTNSLGRQNTFSRYASITLLNLCYNWDVVCIEWDVCIIYAALMRIDIYRKHPFVMIQNIFITLEMPAGSTHLWSIILMFFFFLSW